jgi:hypothetical protein
VKAPLPYVFRELPSCTACGSVSLRIGKTIKQDDGKLQYATCKACGCRQKIVWEIPLGGIADWTPSKIRP